MKSIIFIPFNTFQILRRTTKVPIDFTMKCMIYFCVYVTEFTVEKMFRYKTLRLVSCTKFNLVGTFWRSKLKIVSTF